MPKCLATFMTGRSNEAKCLATFIVGRSNEAKCLATVIVVLASRTLYCSIIRVNLPALISVTDNQGSGRDNGIALTRDGDCKPRHT